MWMFLIEQGKNLSNITSRAHSLSSWPYVLDVRFKRFSQWTSKTTIKSHIAGPQSFKLTLHPSLLHEPFSKPPVSFPIHLACPCLDLVCKFPGSTALFLLSAAGVSWRMQSRVRPCMSHARLCMCVLGGPDDFRKNWFPRHFREISKHLQDNSGSFGNCLETSEKLPRAF